MMNYKIYLYVFFTLMSLFAMNGIHFEKFMKKGKIWEARLLVFILAFSFGYILTNFVSDFIQLSKIF